MYTCKNSYFVIYIFIEINNKIDHQSNEIKTLQSIIHLQNDDISHLKESLQSLHTIINEIHKNSEKTYANNQYYPHSTDFISMKSNRERSANQEQVLILYTYILYLLYTYVMYRYIDEYLTVLFYNYLCIIKDEITKFTKFDF